VSFRGIITKKEGREMLAEAKLYQRKVPVKAAQITRRFSVESRSGVIETGMPGDYLLEDTLVPDDLWIVKKSVFEAEFEQVSGEETKSNVPDA
jgi:hypothetical protein